MALKKTTTYKGIETDYWRIIQSNQDYNNDRTLVTLALYKNRAARLDSKNNFIKTDEVKISLTQTRAAMYTAIKLLTEITDAEDVLE